MSKSSLSIVTGSLAVTILGVSVTACSPGYTPARDPYMSLTTPSMVDKKPFPNTPPGYVDMAEPPMPSAIPQPAQEVEPPYIEPVTVGGPSATGATN